MGVGKELKNRKLKRKTYAYAWTRNITSVL